MLVHVRFSRGRNSTAGSEAHATAVATDNIWGTDNIWFTILMALLTLSLLPEALARSYLHARAILTQVMMLLGVHRTYTLHPTPYTLKLAPYALQPTPYAMHFSP